MPPVDISYVPARGVVSLPSANDPEHICKVQYPPIDINAYASDEVPYYATIHSPNQMQK